LAALQLDNDAVVTAERARVAQQGDFDTPLWVMAPFIALCWVLDVVYVNRPIQK
jgi:ubiquinol oxidase